jgi:VCBS repeat-containing protein
VASAGVTILPTVTEDVSLGDASYVAIVNLLNIDLQVIADAIEFEVDTGHTQDLQFDFSGILNVGVLGNYNLVLQKWDAVTEQWTGIDGQGESTPLSLSLLGGTSGTVTGLEPGEYRAFMGYNDGTLLGVGVGGTLTLNATDYDFTEIAGYEAVPATGNVLINDDVPVGTTVQSVDGTTIDPGGTTIQGDFGQLTILPNGTFTYTPTASGAGIGKVDTFEYTLVDADGKTGTATLNVQIGSDSVTLAWDGADPSQAATFEFSATGDDASASVVWENVTNDAFFDDSEDVLISLLQPTTTYNSQAFVVTDSMDVSGTIVLSVIAAALSNGEIALQREVSPGNWQNVQSAPFSILVGLLGPIATIDLSTVDFTAGNYRVHATLSGVGVGVQTSLTTNVDVTYTDQFEIGSATGDTGNLLTNDDLGSAFTSFQIFDGTSYVKVTGAMNIVGDYGTLTVNSDGSYSYVPDPTLTHFTDVQTDTFEYQLVHPTGSVEQSSLVVTVEPSGAGVPVQTMMMFVADDIGGLDQIDATHDDGSSSHAPTDSHDDLSQLIDDTDDDLTIPLEGLDALSAPDDSDADLTTVEERVDMIDTPDPVDLPVDPLGHLATEDDWNSHNSHVV